MCNLAVFFPSACSTSWERMERWLRTPFWPWICSYIFIWAYVLLWMLFFHVSSCCGRDGRARKLHDCGWTMKGSLLLCCPRLWESCWWEISLDRRCLPSQAETHTTIRRGKKEGVFVESQELTHNWGVLEFCPDCKSGREKGWSKSESN